MGDIISHHWWWLMVSIDDHNPQKKSFFWWWNLNLITELWFSPGFRHWVVRGLVGRISSIMGWLALIRIFRCYSVSAGETQGIQDEHKKLLDTCWRMLAFKNPITFLFMTRVPGGVVSLHFPRWYTNARLWEAFIWLNKLNLEEFSGIVVPAGSLVYESLERGMWLL